MTPGVPYVWIDTSSGTELFLDDDDFASIPLPFDFTFYDKTFSTISRATLKTSVDTGAEVAARLTQLVRELKKQRVE